MRTDSAGLIGCKFSCAGDIRAKRVATQGTAMDKPMSTNRPEQPEKPDDDPNLDAVSEVEAGIRDFVRNDIAYLRRPATTPTAGASETAADTGAGAEATVNNLNSLIQRVAGTSLSEIENLITELETIRTLLHEEGQRVQREIAGYAQLSQAAMKSTRMIADNVAQWKRLAEPVARRD